MCNSQGQCNFLLPAVIQIILPEMSVSGNFSKKVNICTESNLPKSNTQSKTLLLFLSVLKNYPGMQLFFSIFNRQEKLITLYFQGYILPFLGNNLQEISNIPVLVIASMRFEYQGTARIMLL